MSAPDWFAVIDATWPAAAVHKIEGWTLREGRGGGKRVSAATGSGKISVVEEAHRKLGQEALFMIRPADTELDQRLASQGYSIIDPVVIMAKSLVQNSTGEPVETVATPDTIRIWDAGGVGEERRAVMARASGPKTVIQQAGGCSFVACHGDVAMIHALEVSPLYRRRGIAREIERAACDWAPTRKIAALTVASNEPSRALFKTAGYCEVARYHYRIKKRLP
ncbi:MAG: GNAT family N-acetyltransferase [Pseudomonadota bacterium]